jgi:hypothetical protein
MDAPTNHKVLGAGSRTVSTRACVVLYEDGAQCAEPHAVTDRADRVEDAIWHSAAHVDKASGLRGDADCTEEAAAARSHLRIARQESAGILRRFARRRLISSPAPLGLGGRSVRGNAGPEPLLSPQ